MVREKVKVKPRGRFLLRISICCSFGARRFMTKAQAPRSLAPVIPYSAAMGGGPAKPDPPPDPVLREPWRRMNWRDKQKDLDYVDAYKPSTEGLQIRILLHGPVGAGKSSFINSALSALRGRMCVPALADNTSGDSFTKRVTDSFHPFVFNDIMGLGETSGTLVDDVKLAFKGHVKDGYTFHPHAKLSEADRFYNQAPTDNDKVHVLVCVLAANTLPSMSDDTKRKIREIRLEASRLDIPQVVVLTKVDLACPEVGRDLRDVYRSKRVKRLMEQFSADVGIPMNCIFPVKNYHEETDLRDDVDALILSALKNIINFGDDFIHSKNSPNV